MTSLSETFDPSELHNICDMDEGFKGLKKIFERIREWLNHQKDDNPRLKVAITHQEPLKGKTPLHAILELIPPDDVVEKFIDYAPEVLQIKDVNEKLPIHTACSSTCGSFGVYYLEVVEALVNGYPKSLTVEDSYGWLPLHLVIKTSNPRLIY